MPRKWGVGKARNLVRRSEVPESGSGVWGLPGTDPPVIEHSCGKSSFFLGKSTISMALFNSYVYLSEGIVGLAGY